MLDVVQWGSIYLKLGCCCVVEERRGTCERMRNDCWIGINRKTAPARLRILPPTNDDARPLFRKTVKKKRDELFTGGRENAPKRPCMSQTCVRGSDRCFQHNVTASLRRHAHTTRNTWSHWPFRVRGSEG